VAGGGRVRPTALFSRLLRQLCPTARVASRFYDVAAEEPAPTVIRVAPSFINRKLGTTLEASRMKAMLEGIEFQVTQEEDLFTIVVPTFRATRDIRIPEDVVEEIGRLHGFDNIVPQPLTAPVAPTPVVPSRPLERRARQSLVADGYCEVMTYSFASASQLELLGCSLHGAVTLKNPISSDFPGLRRALMPGLLGLAVKNGLARDDFRLFEVGRVFFPAPAAGEIPAQRRHVAGLIYSKSGDHFEAYRLLKGHVENLFGRLGRSGLEFHPVTGAEQAPWVVPSKARTIRLAGAECGVVGMLNPYVRARTKMRGKVVFFELDLDVLLRARPGPVRFEPLPRFPAIENDLSVIVGQEIPYEQVEGIIRHAGGELLEGLELFAAFRGQPIPEGKKSLSFHLRFRSPSRTLQDQEVAPLVQHILAAVQQGVGGEIRTA
jgi:phenylalanyl-tRNA synthetase beta chain